MFVCQNDRFLSCNLWTHMSSSYLSYSFLMAIFWQRRFSKFSGRRINCENKATTRVVCFNYLTIFDNYNFEMKSLVVDKGKKKICTYFGDQMFCDKIRRFFNFWQIQSIIIITKKQRLVLINISLYIWNVLHRIKLFYQNRPIVLKVIKLYVEKCTAKNC